MTLGVPTVYANCYPSEEDAAGRRHVVVRADEDVVATWLEEASNAWAEAGVGDRPTVRRVPPGDLAAAERLFAAEPIPPTAFVCLDALAVEAVRRGVAARRLGDASRALLVARGSVGHPCLLAGLPEPPVTVGAAVSELTSVGVRTLLDGARWRAGADLSGLGDVVLPVRIGGATSAPSPRG